MLMGDVNIYMGGELNISENTAVGLRQIGWVQPETSFIASHINLYKYVKWWLIPQVFLSLTTQTWAKGQIQYKEFKWYAA